MKTLLLTLISLVVAQEIRIIPLNDSPGILPFKLGLAHIISSKHVFLHYVNLSTLNVEVANIKRCYVDLNTTLSKISQDHSKDFKSLPNIYNHLKPLIDEIDRKLTNILYSSKRTKRGLFNFIGTINKWFTGTLDADDGERYEKALRTLENNQNEIVKHVNSQISLSKQLVNNYAKTIGTLTENQQKVMKFITDFKNQYHRSDSKSFQSYALIFSALDQIHINANVLINFLDNLENAITFARLFTIHPDIINIKEVEEILAQLSLFYTPEEIPNFELQTWYSIIKTTCHFSKDQIIFSLQIPIVHPNTFDYYHLYPIPTKNNTFIVPPQPFLALHQKLYQFMDNPCDEVENRHLCPQQILQSNPEDECIPALIIGRNIPCLHTPVEVKEEIIEKINNENIILLTNNKTKVKGNCDRPLLTIVKGVNLIQIPTNCSIEIGNHRISNSRTIIGKYPIILPNLDEKFDSALWKKQQPIQLKDVSLDEIQSLQKQFEAMQPFDIEKLDDHSTTNWILWAMLFIVTAIIIIYLIYKIIVKYRDSNNQARRPVPSVLFTPEGTS